MNLNVDRSYLLFVSMVGGQMTQGWDFIFSGVAGGFLGAIVVALVDCYLNWRLRKKERSKGYLDQSILLIQRSYEIFTSQGDSPPKNDRVLWLTTARMIERFQMMKKRLTEEDHILIADEHEEYWRLKFYSLLYENRDSLDLKYFKPGKKVQSMLDRTSVVVIFHFRVWKEGRPDPLNSVDVEERIGSKALFLDFPEVLNFISHHDSL